MGFLKWLAVILIILWLVGWLLSWGGYLIHIVLAVAILAFIISFFTDKKTNNV